MPLLLGGSMVWKFSCLKFYFVFQVTFPSRRRCSNSNHIFGVPPYMVVWKIAIVQIHYASLPTKPWQRHCTFDHFLWLIHLASSSTHKSMRERKGWWFIDAFWHLQQIAGCCGSSFWWKSTVIVLFWPILHLHNWFWTRILRKIWSFQWWCFISPLVKIKGFWSTYP